MVKQVYVNGYEEYIQALKEYKSTPGGLYFLFSAPEWCPDCVKAEPVIQKGLEKARPIAVLVHVNVGDKESWKNPTNCFRTDENVTSIPTLLKYKTPIRLEEEQCSDLSLVEMLFED